MSGLVATALAWIRGSRAGIADTLVGLGGQAGTAVVGLVTSILLARQLPAADVGTYALLISVVAFANGLVDMGVTQTAIRFGAQRIQAGDTTAVAAIVRWATHRRVIAAVIFAIVGTLLGPRVAARAWGSADAARYITIAVWIPVAGQFASNVTVLLQASGRFARNTAAALAISAVNLFVLLGLASTGRLSLSTMIVGSATAAAIGSLAVQWFVPERLRIWASLRIGYQPVPVALAPFARMMIITAVTAQIVQSADLWILGAVARPEDIASYSLAQRFTIPLSLAIVALGSALWPRFAAADGLQSSRALGLRLLRMALLGAAPIVAYSLLAPLLAPILFGPHYRSSILLGQVLCLRYVFALFGTVVTGLGYNAGVGLLYPVLNIGRFAVLAVVGLTLSRRLGAVAFAIGMVVAEAFLVGAAAYLVHRVHSSSRYLPDDEGRASRS